MNMTHLLNGSHTNSLNLSRIIYTEVAVNTSYKTDIDLDGPINEANDLHRIVSV